MLNQKNLIQKQAVDKINLANFRFWTWKIRFTLLKRSKCCGSQNSFLFWMVLRPENWLTPYIQGIPRNLFPKTLYKLLKYYIAKIIREDPTHNLNANDFFHVLGNINNFYRLENFLLTMHWPNSCSQVYCVIHRATAKEIV